MNIRPINKEMVYLDRRHLTANIVRYDEQNYSELCTEVRTMNDIGSKNTLKLIVRILHCTDSGGNDCIDYSRW